MSVYLASLEIDIADIDHELTFLSFQFSSFSVQIQINDDFKTNRVSERLSKCSWSDSQLQSKLSGNISSVLNGEGWKKEAWPDRVKMSRPMVAVLYRVSLTPLDSPHWSWRNTRQKRRIQPRRPPDVDRPSSGFSPHSLSLFFLNYCSVDSFAILSYCFSGDFDNFFLQMIPWFLPPDRLFGDFKSLGISAGFDSVENSAGDDRNYINSCNLSRINNSVATDN